MDEEGAPEPFKKVFEDSNGHISLSAFATLDGLKLFIDCHKLDAHDARSVTAQDLLGMLKPVPRELIKTEFIEEIARELNKGGAIVHRRVAKGLPAKDGNDGRLELAVKKYQPMKRDVPIEFRSPRSMHLFDNIEKDDAIGKLHPPDDGMDGRDVLGKVIKAKPGKVFHPSFDRSLTLSPPEGKPPVQKLIAAKAGLLADDSGTLSIHEELFIEGDVGFKTGDIDFIGSVRVDGDVLKDFKILARNDVTVYGNAIHCSIVSSSGSIRIEGAAYGAAVVSHKSRESKDAAARNFIPGRSQYRAAKSFYAATLQGTTVEAEGDIEISSEASNAVLRTRGAIRMPDAHLFGGVCYVVAGIEAGIIGTRLGSPTEIYFCSDIESSAEYPSVVDQIEAQEETATLFRLHLGPYAQAPELIEKLPEAQKLRMRALSEKYSQVESSLSELRKRKEMLLKCATFNPILRVNVRETFFRGASIICGEHIFAAESDIEGPVTIEYVAAENRFDVGELKPLDDPKAKKAPEPQGQAKANEEKPRKKRA